VTEKKVAFITGVARGQGRAHAVKLTSKGMNIIGLDICADIPSMDYPNATEDDICLSPDGGRDEVWTDIIDVNLAGVLRTIEVVLPAIMVGERRGQRYAMASLALLEGPG
jgi:NAD(P)-dependent dehydrogenase (short-subunit alcohol dehydrogenase family)